ncbi:MAG: uroporphyrinogen-III synthase [Paludibacteraceae bacterium]|nr:uroporphyrinogen-III synthase [Paludibacteraceae bacterium]MBP9039913.1 uroporphyrinogen-III synthase [Paludibacteraceae bacterium]MDI9536633.1 uroporphyrinogen-III synthase [Bacteroidota bacterium]
MKIKKILVSQPKPESEKSPYYDLAKKYGVTIDFRPFIKVEPISSVEFRQQKINISDYSAVTFTSRTGIDHFFRMCKELRITVADDLKYFCISESVAFYLQKYIQFRKRKVFYGTSGKLPELISVMSKHETENFLIVLSDTHNEEIINLLTSNNVKFDVGLMYRTVSNDFTNKEEFNYDMLLFFSPQGVASLMKNFPDFQQGEIQIGCFGTTTAQAVRDAGLRLDLSVPTLGCSSMALALNEFIKENHKAAKK